MAINKKPQSSGTDAARNQSGANINGVKPQQPDLGSSLQDFPDNVSSSINPPVSTVSKSNPSIISTTTRPWWQMWQLWGILLVLCSGGIGYGATSMLLKLPKTQSCSKVFWPIASASVRLYCAQTAAEEQDVKGLLSAIDLVAVLPENHPLRPEINRNIDRWATSILEIGETEFQAGNLDQAIATARKIPNHVSASKLVEEKIENWQSVWSTGEDTYEQVENKLREADWNEAFTWAVRLTDSSNDYWATTKYEESINNINVAQEENASLTKAKTQLTNGRIEDLILAIDRADDINPNSYTYDQAQEIIVEAKSKLVASIEQLIEDRNWQQLLQVTGRIPRSLGLQKRNRDWRILANAGASANLDTAFGIEDAIKEAQKLEKDSEYYRLGQKLIKRWKLEIKDVARLTKARDFARVGTIANLNKAVSEAKLIPKPNPRYSEAREEIAKWRGQIKTIEDKPVLNRARELSYGSNVNAWRRAIAEASSISDDSPIYSEAQSFIRSWRSNIQRVEDRPILDEAESFANINNYPAAIETAQQISSGRALYAEAQSSIARWQQEIDGQRYLREANELALQGTFNALSRAIQIAKQAPPSSSVRDRVLQDVNEWAAQILAIARQAANTSLERGIAIAEKVPAGTTSYTPAQKDIKIWQIQLNPPQPEIVPPTFKLDKLRKERDN
ncbi:MAG: chromosome segregation ATPase [Cyanobacteria bacterium P01_A01_bin.83]